MTRITTYLSIIILNVNGFNYSMKRYLTNWMKKEDPTNCCLQELISATEISTGLE
jgi:exonuclease III